MNTPFSETSIENPFNGKVYTEEGKYHVLVLYSTLAIFFKSEQIILNLTSSSRDLASVTYPITIYFSMIDH